MSKYVFVKRSDFGSGCGCFLIGLLILALILKALRYLLPFALMAYFVWAVLNYLNQDKKDDDEVIYNSKEGARRSEEQVIIKDNHRFIKDAEVIEDEEDR